MREKRGVEEKKREQEKKIQDLDEKIGLVQLDQAGLERDNSSLRAQIQALEDQK